MRIHFALTCATLLLAVSFAAADNREKTHAVRPAELLAVIGHADKIVVSDSMPGAIVGGGSAPPRILYSSASLRDISELRKAIIIEPPKGWFRCACIPPIEIILSRSGKELGVISVQEDLTIGFSRWSGDARSADQEKLLQIRGSRVARPPRKTDCQVLLDTYDSELLPTPRKYDLDWWDTCATKPTLRGFNGNRFPEF